MNNWKYSILFVLLYIGGSTFAIRAVSPGIAGLIIYRLLRVGMLAAMFFGTPGGRERWAVPGWKSFPKSYSTGRYWVHTALTFAALLIGGVLAGQLTPALGPPGTAPNGRAIAWVILLIVLSAADEELVLRTYLFTLVPRYAFVLLSGVLFSLLHVGQNYVVLLYALYGGGVLGWHYMRFRSTGSVVLLHAGVNLLLIALSLRS